MSESLPNAVDVLHDIAAFSDLPEDALKSVRVSVTPQPIRSGTLLFRQGAVIGRILVVKKGQVSLVRSNETATSSQKALLKHIVREGEMIGRIRLSLDAAQLGEARAKTDVELISIDVKSLLTLAERYPDWARKFDRRYVAGRLRAVPYLAALNDAEIQWLSDIVTVKTAQAGDELAREGARISEAIIIRQGRVRLESNLLQTEWWRSSHAVIGPRGIFTGGHYKCSIIAETKLHYYSVPKTDFRVLTEQHPRENWTQEPIKIESVLARAPLFNLLKPGEIRHLAGYAMQIHAHRAHTIISHYDHPEHYYRILASGQAQKYSYNAIDVPQDPEQVASGYAWCEEAVLNPQQIAKITVETLSPASWLQIHYLDYQAFLNAHPNVTKRSDIHIQTTAISSKDSDAQPKDEAPPLFRKRRHPIVMVKRLATTLGVAILYLLLLSPFAYLDIHVPFLLKWPPVLLWILLSGGWAVADYRNDYFTITHNRIIHEEAVPLISVRQKAAPIDKIQNYRMERKFLARLFRYGQLYISTAAEQGEIKFDYLAYPDRIAQILSEVSNRAKTVSTKMVEEDDYIKRYLRKKLNMETEVISDDRALTEDVVITTTPSQATHRLFGWLKGFMKGFFSSEPEMGERLVWRKHWFGLLLTSFFPLMIAVILIVLLSLIAGSFKDSSFASDARTGTMFITIPIILVTLSWLVWQWIDWRNDFYIVTDHFIEQINQKPLWFAEDRSKIPLGRVENVEYRIPHFIAHILKYGNVSIQTAASKGNINFQFVPHPDTVHADIFARIEKLKASAAVKQSEQRDEAMAKWVKAYHELMAERAQQGPRADDEQ